MSRNYCTLIMLYALVGLAGCTNQVNTDRVSVIPTPVEINAGRGEFEITPNTPITYQSDELECIVDYSANLWESYLGYKLDGQKEQSDENLKKIALALNNNFNDLIGYEGYSLSIKPSGISLTANTKAGILYGVQTIYQLLSTNPNGLLPCLNIIDYPRFGYRGMHLDVSRHFHSVEFIYQMLDHLAMHKINTFHWHLVDDQGWRLEIKKYPKLTEIGAWRADISDRHWNDRPLEAAEGKPTTYGGFYTQDEVRAIVKYAAERNITVMPEIEMPAHVMSALAAYPELSCTGENLGVPPGGVWPITHIYCAGNDETFEFIEDVLIEVMELFPSKLIHIGGDEAFKSEWEKCPKCQQRIKDEGLKDENELQSYFIKRIEKFLNEHDRTLVGWDEILEGGLAPNAVVMSWRGEEGGIEAARMGNRAIMTPGSHCYFDHYQGDPAHEPLAIGGYTTLKKVYGYEPIPEALTEKEGELILGAQANVWTEYMPTTQQVEYMVFPRLAALSEVLWSPKEKRDWADFLKRMVHQYHIYQKLGINYSHSAYQVNITQNLDTINKAIEVSLDADVINPSIRYTLDGSEPNYTSNIYKRPIIINQPTTLKSAVFIDNEPVGKIRTNHYNIHKAFIKSIELEYPNSSRFDGGGKYSLVNGIMGSISYSDGTWKGFLGKDMVATIDLGEPKKIERIAVDALQNITSWIFFPTKAIFEISLDGERYELIHEIENWEIQNQGGKLTTVFETWIPNKEVRYVRVTLKNIGECPKGHSGEGKPAFLFVSEIVVE
ncbi:glycoside hydrolase family 20 protein [Perlabentimonas gracilis]|uniref:glycoside hydrolase family 20 protein n=1 Tax=Perlabentimonas gracilis TaxID=2715279 RepID=UPI00140C7BBB|nr:family 20 glycosylhydrolase [Perlabentimonas gracilis]NHB68704.1 family 20 glycosylhydrolase [Perlabentimonas gracilis]